MSKENQNLEQVNLFDELVLFGVAQNDCFIAFECSTHCLCELSLKMMQMMNQWSCNSVQKQSKRQPVSIDQHLTVLRMGSKENPTWHNINFVCVYVMYDKNGHKVIYRYLGNMHVK